MLSFNRNDRIEYYAHRTVGIIATKFSITLDGKWKEN